MSDSEAFIRQARTHQDVEELPRVYSRGKTNTLLGPPAVIIVDHRAADLRVAGLTVLDRLLVAIHRAGASSITLVAQEAPSGLKRATALGIPFRLVQDAPARQRATLVVSSNVLVQPGDVRSLLQTGGRLAAKNGAALPMGLLPSGSEPWEVALDALSINEATGVACSVTDARSASEATRKLWSSLTSSSDGLVDRHFNRPCGRILSKLLIHTPIHPNAVSLISVAIGLWGAWLFSLGTYPAIVFAALLFQLSAIVDCVDGDLARVLFKESSFGRWLDLAGDQVVHVAVFAGIAVGLMHSGQSPFAPWLGITAVIGAVLSFAVVVRGMRKPPGNCSRTLEKLIDSATNRDFSVLVLLLACFGRLEWFLWLAAVGGHLFWMTALALQQHRKPPEANRGEDCPKASKRVPLTPRAWTVKALWKALGLAAGLALFAWFVSRADWHSVGEALARLGWLAPLALLPYLIVYIVDCLGWRLCLPSKIGIPFTSLFRIRWAGEAVNLVVPSAYVGGEAVKVHLLRKKGISAQVGTSVAVVSKTAQTVGQLFFVLLAAGMFLRLGNHAPGVYAAMLAILGTGLALLIALFWIQRCGLFASLVKLARAFRLKLGFIEKRWSKVLEVDEAITSFYRQHRPRFYASIGVYFAGWLLDTLEIYVVSRLLGMPIEWTQALVVEAFTGVVKWLSPWVPGSVGVQESGIMLLGRLVGLPDTLNVAYPVLRRGRELIFTLIGWLLLYTEHIGLGKIRAESATSETSPTPASPQ